MSGDPDGERTDNHEYFMPEVGSDDWGKPVNDNFRKLEKSSPLVVPEDEIDDKQPHDNSIIITSDSHKLFIGDGNDWNEIGRISGEQEDRQEERIEELEEKVERLEEDARNLG